MKEIWFYSFNSFVDSTQAQYIRNDEHGYNGFNSFVDSTGIRRGEDE